MTKLLAGHGSATDADIVLTVKCGEQLLTTIGGIKVLIQCGDTKVAATESDADEPEPPRFPDDHLADVIDISAEVPEVDLPKFYLDKIAYINVGNVIDELATEQGINPDRSASVAHLPGVASLSVHGHDVDGPTLRDLLTRG